MADDFFDATETPFPKRNSSMHIDTSAISRPPQTLPVPKEATAKSRYEALCKPAYLDVLLPRSSTFDATKFLRDGAPEQLSRAPARRNLFFDENTNLYIVLRTALGEDDVRLLLPDLEVAISAHATDAVPQGSGNAASASGKHDLTSKTFPASQAVDVVSVSDHTYVVWTTSLHLSRPRARLQRPAIYFTAHLTLTAEALASKKDSKDYLRSFEPIPANVLEPLQFDPALSGSKSQIHLSETRITKVAPAAARTHDDVKPVRGASKRAFPVVPALFTRIKYSALPDTVVASLHLETSQVVTGTVNITNVTLDSPDAVVESLCPMSQPLETRGGDETVLLYRFTRTADVSSSAGAHLAVSITAKVSTDQSPEVEIDVKFQAQVDLFQTASMPSYRWSRPLSASKEALARLSYIPSEAVRSSDIIPNPSTEEAGITFNFTADPAVHQNKEFQIQVQCINQSNRPRRFALVVLQPKRTHTRVQQHHTTTSEDTDLIASIFNAAPLERQKSPDVLDLNPDVRIGPLPPGACFETQMKFRAVSSGVLDLGVVRIVDLDTKQTVDVRELPDIVSLEPDDEADGREMKVK